MEPNKERIFVLQERHKIVSGKVIGEMNLRKESAKVLPY